MLAALSVLVKYVAQFLTGGLLMAALWLIDHFTSYKIPKHYYKWILIAIVIWAALASYRDEHHNAQLLTNEKSDISGKLSICDKERAVAQESSSLLGGQLAQRDGLIANQQDTFNKCILAMGVKNIPEPQRLDVQWATVGEQHDKNNAVAAQTVLFVAQTNKPLPAVRHKITCPFPFKFHTFALSQKESLSYIFESGQDSEKEASFSMQREWLPGSSLIVVTTIAQENVNRASSCVISPKR